MNRMQALKLQAILALAGIGLWGVLAVAHSADINSVNTGQIIGGSYFNTAGSRTTFTNSAGGGLWLHSGNTLRGVETNAGPTSCGAVNFTAPGNVVRIDGQIDVSGLQQQGTPYLGNGGTIYVDSLHKFQSGSSSPQGASSAVTPNKVTAMASTNNLGANSVNAAGLLTANSGNNNALVSSSIPGLSSSGNQLIRDAAGKIAGAVDANVIAIEGAGIKRETVAIADAVESQDGVIKIISLVGPVIPVATMASVVSVP